MAAYQSFSEQMSGFLARPHSAVPDVPIRSRAAWRVADLDDNAWRFELPSRLARILGDAVDGALAAKLPMEQATAKDVPVEGLNPLITQWRAALENGPGFAHVRGLPVEQWGEKKSAYAFWILGHYLGLPGAQNPAKELLGHVKDYDEFKHNPNVRRYRTAGNIDFHCDPADVVGLLCLSEAKTGGESRIASSVAIVNTLLETDPALLEPLFSTAAFDRRDEEKPGELGYFEYQPCCYANGRLSSFYHSEYLRSAARHFNPPELPRAFERSLDKFDELANSPAYRLDMILRPGDMQFLSNHTIVHARTAYEDWPEPERRRHLLRLWLSLK